MNDCQGKALKEGCHERDLAQMGVSSTEKTNTKRNLAISRTGFLTQLKSKKVKIGEDKTS